MALLWQRQEADDNLQNLLWTWTTLMIQCFWQIHRLHSLERATNCLGLHVKADKTESMCFNQRGDISILINGSLKILNKSWRHHPTRHQLYGHLPPITKTIQVRRTRHAGHCWRSNDELISYVLLWTPAYGQAKAGRPA